MNNSRSICGNYMFFEETLSLKYIVSTYFLIIAKVPSDFAKSYLKKQKGVHWKPFVLWMTVVLSITHMSKFTSEDKAKMRFLSSNGFLPVCDCLNTTFSPSDKIYFLISIFCCIFAKLKRRCYANTDECFWTAFLLLFGGASAHACAYSEL